MSDPRPMRRSRVTLADVAQRARVSRAMASIVIREAPGATEVTRHKVLTAARELGYRPDARARALAGQRARLIGVLFGLGGNFHFDLIEGLYRAADLHRHNLLLAALTPGRGEAEALDSLSDFSFDGLVMLGPAIAAPLIAGKRPVVAVGWHVDDDAVDVVRTSDDVGMGLAVDHLIALGHRRIAHIDGGPGQIAEARRAAYLAAMDKRGLSHLIQVARGGGDQLGGHAGARELIESGREFPTGVIAYNDDVAVAAMGVFAQAGIVMPDRVSMVGWDDSAIAAMPGIELTSVAQRPHEMAERAVERIVDRCDGAVVPEREIILLPTLTVRASTVRASPTRA